MHRGIHGKGRVRTQDLGNTRRQPPRDADPDILPRGLLIAVEPTKMMQVMTKMQNLMLMARRANMLMRKMARKVTREK